MPAGLLDAPLAVGLALMLKRAEDMWVGARIAEAVWAVDVGGVLLLVGHPRELVTAMVFVVIMDETGLTVALFVKGEDGRSTGEPNTSTRHYSSKSSAT